MITENITGLHDLLKIALMNTDVLWGWKQRTQLSSANVSRTTTSCLTLEWCTSCVSLSERFTLKFGSPSSLCSALPEIQCKTLFSHWHKHKRSSTRIRAQKPANWLIEQTKPCASAACLAKTWFSSVPCRVLQKESISKAPRVLKWRCLDSSSGYSVAKFAEADQEKASVDLRWVSSGLSV